MPRKTIITCDLCGDAAQAYPAMFTLLNRRAHQYVPNPNGNGMVVAPPEYAVMPHNPFDAEGPVYLCTQHYDDLFHWIEQWFHEQFVDVLKNWTKIPGELC